VGKRKRVTWSERRENRGGGKREKEGAEVESGGREEI